ncbi:transcription factor LHW-like [Hibiscus syriacus]|uniref:Transcription factor LHW-like n=1 Tax=Hibiscus syriacus TaxID=106335 RepID=A0A6A3CHU4_HIBSY|nr:transcription factor LHW-like [Hibiscus syriacus]
MSAYANRHAFIHLPQWVLQERRERRSLDILERKGIVTPNEPYICGVCGRKCKTNLDLKKHFSSYTKGNDKETKQNESLKGKKRQRFKERYISGNHKYNEAAKSLIKPRIGYGLASELRSGGFRGDVEESKGSKFGDCGCRDWDRGLGRHADLWVSWVEVENGELTEKDLVPKEEGEQ